MWRAIARIEDLIACAALVLFTLFIITSVVFRYVLDAPLSWTQEASLISFAWLLFLGAAICAREDAHVLIDLYAPAPESHAGRASEAFAAFVGAAASLAMSWIACRYTIGAATMVTPIFRVSSAVYNAAAPVGLALVALHLIHRGAVAILGRKAPPPRDPRT